MFLSNQTAPYLESHKKELTNNNLTLKYFQSCGPLSLLSVYFFLKLITFLKAPTFQN